MSRSLKKKGIIKDKGCDKAYYNRRFRRINKYRLRIEKEPLLLAEIVNGYIICDYVLRYPDYLGRRITGQRLWLAHYRK